MAVSYRSTTYTWRESGVYPIFYSGARSSLVRQAHRVGIHLVWRVSQYFFFCHSRQLGGLSRSVEVECFIQYFNIFPMFHTCGDHSPWIGIVPIQT